MSNGPRIAQITIYPIKSFDGMDVKEAGLRKNGSLEWDREFAFIEPDGNPLDGRKDGNISMFKVRVSYDPSDYAIVTFSAPELGMEKATFNLATQGKEAEEWMNQALGRPAEQRLTLTRFHETGIADDMELTGPTLIARPTLDRLASETGHTNTHRRFRSNIILDGLPTEDVLYGSDNDSGVPIRMGNLALHGVNPCMRCKVPARDPESGALDKNFAAKIVEDRKQTVVVIPEARDRMEKTGYYRLAVNTAPVGEQFGKIAVGDPVEIGPLERIRKI